MSLVSLAWLVSYSAIYSALCDSFRIHVKLLIALMLIMLPRHIQINSFLSISRFLWSLQFIKFVFYFQVMAGLLHLVQNNYQQILNETVKGMV